MNVTAEWLPSFDDDYGEAAGYVTFEDRRIRGERHADAVRQGLVPPDAPTPKHRIALRYRRIRKVVRRSASRAAVG